MYQYQMCVVGGAGHIGLPFSLVFANQGLNVVIYDINLEAMETIKNGHVPFIENGAEELLATALQTGKLTFTNNPEFIAESETIVITIGTPVDEFLNPVLKGMDHCIRELLPYLHDDQLILLRSTVFPGTTDWLAEQLKSYNKKTKLAFCPERIMEGKAIEEIYNLPQIISGTTHEAEEAAQTLFNHLGIEIVRLSPLEAEFSKLFSNAYRYITFAIANQFYMITASAGVDYDRVLSGMKYHYPRLSGLPKAGFAAGPCLFKDTMQLNAYANNEFFLGQAAMNVNEGLVLFIIDQLSKKYELQNLKVGLLGMAFKADNDDIRASLSYKLKKHLKFKAKEVLTTDPFVTVDQDLKPLDEVIQQSDILILCAPHKIYQSIDLQNKPVVDVWGFFKNGTLI